MDISEFKIGKEFWCGGKRWRCTDVGTRVVVAICISNFEHDLTWLSGPPYACAESVFDEYDQEGCSVNRSDFS